MLSVEQCDLTDLRSLNTNGVLRGLHAEIDRVSEDFVELEAARLASGDYALDSLPEGYLHHLQLRGRAFATAVVPPALELARNPRLKRIVTLWDLDDTMVDADTQITHPAAEPVIWHLSEAVGPKRLRHGILTDKQTTPNPADYFPTVAVRFDPRFVLSCTKGALASRLSTHLGVDRHHSHSRAERANLLPLQLAAVMPIIEPTAIAKLADSYHAKFAALSLLAVKYPDYGFVWVDNIGTTRLADPNHDRVRAVHIAQHLRPLLADNLVYIEKRAARIRAKRAAAPLAGAALKAA